MHPPTAVGGIFAFVQNLSQQVVAEHSALVVAKRGIVQLIVVSDHSVLRSGSNDR